MLSNVIGRVNNTSLPKNQSLLPLFEAIVNSIDSIEELGSVRGRIDINLLRKPGLLLTSDTEGKDQYKNPIYAFEIIDNGIGFIEENFRAFNEADSMKKVSKGGKGVGRFIWLKAFEHVLIDSLYVEDEKIYHRQFTFSLGSIGGIQNHTLSEDTQFKERKTSVKLNGLKDYYESLYPKNSQTIGQKIVGHCINYFLLGKMPQIFLHDEDSEDILDLWDIYGALVEQQQTTVFQLRGQEFTQIHFLLHMRGELKHNISYCANNRVVKETPVGPRIPNLPQYIQKGEDNFIYAGYIFSPYLDGKVNQQRTDFDLLSPGGLEFPGEIPLDDIEEKGIENAKEFLDPYTKEAKQKKEEFINCTLRTHS